jgi:lipoate-protein ligase A
MLKIFDTGTDLASANMRFDEELLQELKPDADPILHLYHWTNPSATFGYFIEVKKHLDLEKAKKWDLDLARRPTGGGIVFHIWDLAFSFLMPAKNPHFSVNTLQNYQFVNSTVLEVVRNYFCLSPELIKESVPTLGIDCQNFCMAKPTQYDVVYQGMKIAGAAQRRRAQGYLHQGTISLALPNLELLEEVLLSKKDVLEAMNIFTFAPVRDAKEMKSVREDLQKLLADKLKEALSFSL